MNQPQYVRSLENVKVGDLFMVYRNHGWRKFYLAAVQCESVTEKQCVIAGKKVRKSDARVLGDGGYGASIYIYDEELLGKDKIALMASNARYYLRNTDDWEKLSDDKVLAIATELKQQIIKEQPNDQRRRQEGFGK